MEHTLSEQILVDKTKFKQSFFDKIEPIILVDPLASTLGALNSNEPFIFYYKDIIKYSGHSCPAVAGAYKMTQLALRELYKDTIPIRGAIKITMKGSVDEKVNGPISQVISFITGAAGETGFKGMNGKFNRQNLLQYDNTDISSSQFLAESTFERIDSGGKVTVTYNPSSIPSNPEMGKIMPLLISGKASKEEIIKFGDLWQERVRVLLLETPEDAFTIKNLV